MKNLYLISQDVNDDYDTWDSAIVCAESEEKARMIHPSGSEWDGEDKKWGSWCAAKDVKVKLIGKAVDGAFDGVELASFNAG